MKQLQIKADRKYQIFIDINYRDELAKVAQQHTKVLVITPHAIAKMLKLRSSKNITYLTVPNGESQKDLKNVERIWKVLGKENFSRSDAIIGLGGGATTDLAGFAAATWLRGISWYAFPTSLAAMVDASIGGKTAINSESGKNLIGSFYSPAAVYIDLNFLQSLSKRDLSAGMAEVIKCGFIDDPKILDLVRKDLLDFKEIIYRSVSVKARVVNKDFKENRLREILNYGHTLGHAIEKHSKYKLRHGEAISIGLVFAAELSNIVGTLPSAIVAEHRTLLKSFNLPTTYPQRYFSELIKLMKSDKKVKNQKLRFIGLNKVGKPQWFEEVTNQQIKSAYERISA